MVVAELSFKERAASRVARLAESAAVSQPSSERSKSASRVTFSSALDAAAQSELEPEAEAPALGMPPSGDAPTPQATPS